MKTKQIISFLVIPVVMVWLMLFSDIGRNQPQVASTLAVALLMAVWWVSEVVPLAVTALLPVVLFPLFGVMNGAEVSATYFNEIIFLFMGGFMVALAMERWDLHRRIALNILLFTGVTPGRILLGFMVASFFLSMWISNSATAMMMLPIALSVIHQFDGLMNKEAPHKFGIAILLGIAYSASIGGMATLVGTPANLSFSRIYQIYFPDAPEISFSVWLLFALPVSLIIFAIAFTYLYFHFKPKKNAWVAVGRDSFSQQLHGMGPATQEQKMVMGVFVMLALLWMLRVDLKFGAFIVPGWDRIFNHSSYLNDGTVAIAMAIVLFILPSKNRKGQRLLDWPTASKVPWQILLLFGGGFALATGMKASGLSMWIGHQLSDVARIHPLALILMIAFSISFLTELTSNTATTEMILPILAGISIAAGIHPLLMMIPATMAASMAFMLPVATPPNAIVFGSERIGILTMARTGFVLNLMAVLVVSLMIYFWGDAFLGGYLDGQPLVPR